MMCYLVKQRDSFTFTFYFKHMHRTRKFNEGGMELSTYGPKVTVGRRDDRQYVGQSVKTRVVFTTEIVRKRQTIQRHLNHG
jgi:hypothetical protein